MLLEERVILNERAMISVVFMSLKLSWLLHYFLTKWSKKGELLILEKKIYFIKEKPLDDIKSIKLDMTYIT